MHRCVDENRISIHRKRRLKKGSLNRGEKVENEEKNNCSAFVSIDDCFFDYFSAEEVAELLQEQGKTNLF